MVAQPETRQIILLKIIGIAMHLKNAWLYLYLKYSQVSIQVRQLIDTGIHKLRVIHLHDFVPWCAVIRKEAFKRAKQANIGDGQTEFFLYFTHNGLGTGFAEFDTAADRAEEWAVFDGVVGFAEQYLAIMMEDAKCEGADAVCGH